MSDSKNSLLMESVDASRDATSAVALDQGLLSGSKNYLSFDFLRAFAAILVCGSHIRAFLFVDFERTLNPDWLTRLFYLLTGLGHEAVMVFFVMSGWLIGSSVWSQQGTGFSWKKYAIARVCRLWTVLIPALVLTWGLDSLGRFLCDGHGYDGSLAGKIHSGPSEAVPLEMSSLTLIGNVFFTQTVLVPVFGTNGPLWSLANEFWYYFVFPVIAGAIFLRRVPAIAVAIVALSLLYLLFPHGFWSGFLVWSIGWLASVAQKFVRVRIAHWLVLIFVLSLMACVLISKSNHLTAPDLVLGFLVAGLLMGLARGPARLASWKFGARAIRFLAAMSYSLYLCHFPALAFFFFVFNVNQMQPGWVAFSLFGMLLVGSVVLSAMMWFLFERRTQEIRFVVSRFCLPKQ